MDSERLKKEKLDTNLIAKTISEAFSKQIFIDGFVHADPH